MPCRCSLEVVSIRSRPLTVMWTGEFCPDTWWNECACVFRFVLYRHQGACLGMPHVMFLLHTVCMKSNRMPMLTNSLLLNRKMTKFLIFWKCRRPGSFFCTHSHFCLGFIYLFFVLPVWACALTYLYTFILNTQETVVTKVCGLHPPGWHFPFTATWFI